MTGVGGGIGVGVGVSGGRCGGGAGLGVEPNVATTGMVRVSFVDRGNDGMGRGTGERQLGLGRGRGRGHAAEAGRRVVGTGGSSPLDR